LTRKCAQTPILSQCVIIHTMVWGGTGVTVTAGITA
jgi:hypothetical protein